MASIDKLNITFGIFSLNLITDEKMGKELIPSGKVKRHLTSKKQKPE